MKNENILLKKNFYSCVETVDLKIGWISYAKIKTLSLKNKTKH
jgi:hypothetical protein